MIRIRNLVVDTLALLSLISALAFVFRNDRVEVKEQVVEQTTVEEEGEAPPRETLRLAVTTCVDVKDPAYTTEKHVYDKMGNLLDQLGEGYRYTTIRLSDLEDAEKVASYDVIFLACSLHPRHWHNYSLPPNKSIRPGTIAHQFDAKVMAVLRKNLQGFVRRGGTLYASDFQFEVLHWTFPEFFGGIAFDAVETGEAQTVKAEVVDEGLREHIGADLRLRFDLPGWFPAVLRGPDVATYLTGEYNKVGGGRASAPLLVKTPVNQGTLIYTSFHNEKQNSRQEIELLKFLVFATVTARESARVDRMMVSGGFSPQKSNLLSASSQGGAVNRTYVSRKSGPLRFVLGFAAQGARLRLEVVGPGGRTFRKEGNSTMSLEVPDAPAGEWAYTVTPLEIPYPNYPFTLTIGER